MEGRLDPFYYIPSVVELEKKIRSLTKQKLGSFINYIASGATPIKELGELYYSDKQNGVPFLRVQNILSEGLNLEDVIFINQETHNKMLNRSKVFPNDLLVTITGRIASSCVVPENFEGNINQHSVVIKTHNREVSECLATYLNSNIGQTLALRRTTGGTRPALDYIALKSIPIVFNPKIIDLMKAAYNVKCAKEAEAKSLLDSIDVYLLNRLGIETPAATETTKTFFSRASKLSGNRFDPFYHKKEFEELEKILTRINPVRFSSIIEIITKGETPLWKGEIYVDEGVPFLRVQNIEIDGIKGEQIFITEELHNQMRRSKLFGGEILFTMAGSIGIATIFPNDFGEANINQAIAKIVLKSNLELNKKYIVEILNSKICKKQSERFLTVSAQPNINFEQIKSIKIPLPPLEVQEEIAAHIQSIRQQAKDLEREAKAEVERAKAEVEAMILGAAK